MIDSIESLIRLRMSTSDGHYAGGLVDGARILQLFGDAVTEVLIRHDGDEGLMRTMNAEFLAPCAAAITLRFEPSSLPSASLRALLNARRKK